MLLKFVSIVILGFTMKAFVNHVMSGKMVYYLFFFFCFWIFLKCKRFYYRFSWLVVLRFYVALAVFKSYHDSEAGDNQSLKIQVARPGIEPRTSCFVSQELNHLATAATIKGHPFTIKLYFIIYEGRPKLFCFFLLKLFFISLPLSLKLDLSIVFLSIKVTAVKLSGCSVS